MCQQSLCKQNQNNNAAINFIKPKASTCIVTPGYELLILNSSLQKFNSKMQCKCTGGQLTRKTLLIITHCSTAAMLRCQYLQTLTTVNVSSRL